MSFDELVALCGSLQATTTDHPFGPGTLVFKVGGKMFALLGEEAPHWCSLKAMPDVIEDQRLSYPDAVGPAPYLHHDHWNRVDIGSVPDDELGEWVRHSHRVVARGLTRRARRELGLEDA